jgi:hypothetical protein
MNALPTSDHKIGLREVTNRNRVHEPVRGIHVRAMRGGRVSCSDQLDRVLRPSASTRFDRTGRNSKTRWKLGCT